MLQNAAGASCFQWLDQPRLSPVDTRLPTTVSLPCWKFLYQHPVANERFGRWTARPWPVLEAVWCKSEGCVTSGHSQGILVQISGIFMMLLEFWQDVVLHEPCQEGMEPYFPVHLFTVCQVAQLVSESFDPTAGCTELVELSFSWILSCSFH